MPNRTPPRKYFMLAMLYMPALLAGYQRKVLRSPLSRGFSRVTAGAICQGIWSFGFIKTVFRDCAPEGGFSFLRG